MVEQSGTLFPNGDVVLGKYHLITNRSGKNASSAARGDRFGIIGVDASVSATAYPTYNTTVTAATDSDCPLRWHSATRRHVVRFSLLRHRIQKMVGEVLSGYVAIGSRRDDRWVMCHCVKSAFGESVGDRIIFYGSGQIIGRGYHEGVRADGPASDSRFWPEGLWYIEDKKWQLFSNVTYG